MMKHGRVEDRVLHDCIITIFTEGETESVRTMYLQGEYGEESSLKQIREMLPDAKLITVVAEKWNKGRIYRFGNHGEFWEYVGDTDGYA